MCSTECVDNYGFLVIIFPITFMKRHLEYLILFLCWQFASLKREEKMNFLNPTRLIVHSKYVCTFWSQPFDSLHLGSYTWVVRELEFFTF